MRNSKTLIFRKLTTKPSVGAFLNTQNYMASCIVLLGRKFERRELELGGDEFGLQRLPSSPSWFQGTPPGAPSAEVPRVASESGLVYQNLICNFQREVVIRPRVRQISLRKILAYA